MGHDDQNHWRAGQAPGLRPVSVPRVCGDSRRGDPHHVRRCLLNVLLVRRGEAPYEGMWAIPGGFKRPDRDARRGGEPRAHPRRPASTPRLLTQFRAYGDPARPAHERRHRRVPRGPPRRRERSSRAPTPRHAALVPAPDALEGQIELAFDHLRILRDAVERVRVELEVSGIATAFVGTTSRWPSFGPCTRRSGACSSTPRTSAAASSARTAG